LGLRYWLCVYSLPNVRVGVVEATAKAIVFCFQRVFYMVPVFFIGRMRFYSAWLLAECSFVTLALGAYPKSTAPKPGNGPTLDPATNP